MKKLIYFLTSVLTVAMFCYNGWAELIVTDGLVSYWTFDRHQVIGGTVKDVWGENDGTIVGNPKVVSGHVREALEFDGPRDYVNLTNLGDFGTQRGEATFEAWVKTDFKKNWMTLFKVIEDCGGWGMDFNASIRPIIDKGVLIHRVVFAEEVINFYIQHKVRGAWMPHFQLWRVVFHL